MVVIRFVDRILDWLPGPGVAWLTAAVVGANAAAGSLAESAPDGSETVVAWLLRFVSAAAAVLEVMRRSSEVPEMARGVRMPQGVRLELAASREDSQGVSGELIVREREAA